MFASIQADTVLTDAQGKAIHWSQLRGKWVFINYWASWCPSCLEEIAELNKFYQNHNKNDAALFAVNYDGLSLASQHSLIKRFNITYPSLVNDPSAVLALGDIKGLPVTFVVNPSGVLVNTLYGPQTQHTLTEAMNAKGNTKIQQ